MLFLLCVTKVAVNFKFKPQLCIQLRNWSLLLMTLGETRNVDQ
jgi:hypothetical protein